MKKNALPPEENMRHKNGDETFHYQLNSWYFKCAIEFTISKKAHLTYFFKLIKSSHLLIKVGSALSCFYHFELTRGDAESTHFLVKSFHWSVNNVVSTASSPFFSPLTLSFVRPTTSTSHRHHILRRATLISFNELISILCLLHLYRDR